MCEICRQFPCHLRCPNYIPPKSKYYCSICNDGIQICEKYIENNRGDYAHWDCINGIYDLTIFLDIEIKEMEEVDEEDY